MQNRLSYLFFVAALAIGTICPPYVSAQNQKGFPLHVWYVRRTATHIGSGLSYVQNYGPFGTRRQAVQEKIALDANRSSGSYGFGVAEIYQAVNPAFKKAYGQSFPYQANKLGNFEIQLMKQKMQYQRGVGNQQMKTSQGKATDKLGNFEIQMMKRRMALQSGTMGQKQNVPQLSNSNFNGSQLGNRINSTEGTTKKQASSKSMRRK